MSGEEIIGEIKMIKIWKPIYGYENLYEVSNYGEIRSCDRYIKGNKNSKYLKKGKLISISYNHKGYARVRLSKDNVSKMYFVHRLVAQAFIPNPNNLPQVNHKDEVKSNNKIYNLEWCTNKYNHNYGTGIERAKENCDYESISKKLSKEVYQFDLKGTFIRKYYSVTSVSKYGFKPECVINCCKNRKNSYKKYLWSSNKIPPMYIKKNNPTSKMVYQYDMDYKLIKIYDSTNSAEKDGFYRYGIRDCCNNKINSYKGFIWRWEQIDEEI